ncbi:MAG: agmatinase [Chloroflexi bacterium RBG_19FT_COMBO_47_15]|nr:MAG: agmatinase [Chloroflexi bacterium RBG_19FT_COMBO_47_15]
MQNIEDLFSNPQNFAGLISPYADLSTAKVVILPVPYDSTTEWHSGTREGPQAIINASQYLELYDIELDREIYKVGIHTLPKVEPLLNSPEEMIDRVYHIAGELTRQAKFMVMFGGEHSLSLGIVRALKEKKQDLSVLQLDAHADLRDEYLGTKYSHACVMRRILELCPIVQVGIRSLSWEEQRFLAQNNMHPFFAAPSSGLASPEDITALLSDNVYVSIDLDVFDPSIVPAVGTPEPGGMQWHEVLNLLRTVTLHRRIIGFDVVELCPKEGPASCAFLAAKLAYKLIGYAVT